MLPLSALGDTPDYIIGGLRDGRPWAGPDGKGFFSGKGGDRCLSPASFHQKNLFKAALTQLKASHRPFKQGHCSGHLASDVPTRDRNWKSPLGRLPQLSSPSGQTAMSQVSDSDRETRQTWALQAVRSARGPFMEIDGREIVRLME